MESLINFLKNKIGKENAFKAIIILGFAGIALIMLSEFLPQKTKIETEKDMITENFQKETSQKLEEVLSAIDGVGKIKVMLTVSCTEEYVYAEEGSSSNSSGDGKTASQSENKPVLIDAGDKKEALVKKVISPQINGVVIVCEGGGNARICERIYMATATALGISTAKIYVAQGTP